MALLMWRTDFIQVDDVSVAPISPTAYSFATFAHGDDGI
jgi:hypothetical protein